MDHTTEVQIIEKLLSALERHEVPMDEEESRCRVSNYYALDRYEREVQVLFQGYPIIVGHASQLRSLGDFITHDVSGVPVVVIRSQTGDLNAFLNVCRHRGTRLVAEACGKDRKAFVCPYHAWTYETNGRLIHVPLPEGFPSLNRDQCGLIPIPIESKSGFVWVTFSRDSHRADLEGFLGAVAEDLDSFSFDSHVVYRTETLHKSFNWKIGIEIFLESYHFRVLHKNSTYPIFFDTVGVCDQFYPHLRMVTPKRKITRLVDLDRSRWHLRPNATMAYYIFPNTFMFVEQHLFTAMTFFPEGTDRTAIAVLYLVPSDSESERVKKFWDLHIEMLWAAAAEDFMIGESIQKGLRSGANTFMNFGRYEKTLDFFHSAIEDALNNAITPRREINDI